MATSWTYLATFTGRTNYRLRFEIQRAAVDNAGNRSYYNGQVYAERTSGAISWELTPYPFTVRIGNNIWSGTVVLDFRNTSVITVWTGFSDWINHDGNGNLGFPAETYMVNAGLFGNAETGMQWPQADRIPAVPGPPSSPALSNIQPTSITFTWGTADRGHADIDSWGVWISSRSDFASDYWTTTVPLSPRSFTFTGIPPGQVRYFRVNAHNGDGWGPYSTTVSARTLSGAYVSDGTTWRPCEVFISDGTAWQTGLVQVSTGSAWNPAG